MDLVEIVEAIRNGINVEGSTIYITAFPCLPCSKILAKAEIGRLVFMNNYGENEGMRYFKAKNIKVEQITEKEVWG